MVTDDSSQAMRDQQYGLTYTGERYLPWSNDFITAYEHIHRYLYATRYTAGKRVLDIACGEGYGSEILARNAQWVLGVDADATTLDHARSYHAGANIRYVRADAQQFHLAPGSVDVVVSFETLEHFPAQQAFLSAMKSLLAPDGILLLSTPNRAVYTGDQPLHNPFHAHEFDRSELLVLLRTLFRNVGISGQHMIATSLIARTSASTFPRRGTSFTPEATVVDPNRLNYLVGEEPAIAPRYFFVVCSDNPLPPTPATFLLDTRQTLWGYLHDLEPRLTNRALVAEAGLLETQVVLQEAGTKLAAVQTALWKSDTRAWEAEAALATTQTALWKAETRAWEAETKLWQVETRVSEAEARFSETQALLGEAHTQLAYTEGNVRRLRVMRSSLLRTLLGNTAVTALPLRVLILIPGGMNYFYDQTGHRLAEALTALGFDVDVSSLSDLPDVHPRYDWTLVVNISEVLLAYSVTDTAARFAGQMTSEQQSRALTRLAHVRDESRAIASVQLDSAGTYWFDHAYNLCGLVGIPTVFDLGFHDQSAVLLPHQRARYQFVFNGLTDSERVQLDALPVDDIRPVPWVFVGHLTPDRTALVRRLVQEFDSRGFVYMPMLMPFTEGGPHLDEAQFAAVLSRARYQVWRSHHTHFYLESERFRQSALAGGVPVKLMTAPVPAGPLPFRDFLVDAETFADKMREWDFATMRRRVADEFRMSPSLDDSLLAALAVRSPARQYGT